jgi:hypothetical protein
VVFRATVLVGSTGRKAPNKAIKMSMSNEHRLKIKNSNILNVLIQHAEGTREMGATQVTAALGLLKKALPDLSAVQINGDEEGGPVQHKLEISWPSKK